MHGPLTETELFAGRVPRFIGRRLVLLGATVSTNDDAWSFAHEPDADGTVIMAEYQTAGRGRLGRNWYSPRGASIMASVLLVDAVEPRHGPSLGLAAAIAVCDAIREAARLVPQIKWPNDIIINQRKVAGVLVEARQCGRTSSGCVIGLGINCLQQPNHFPIELQHKATSLEIESPSPVSRADVARALLAELDDWLAPARRHDQDCIREAWLRRSATIGRRIHLNHDGRRYSGQVIDVDPLANLVVQLDEGGRRLFAAADTSAVDCE